MRWYWIDRFLEFECGRRAVTVRCVTIGEEHFERYTPGAPLMPHSLILEGFAQTGGLLVGDRGGFTKRVVLAKVSKAVFYGYAQPGDTLRYTCTLEDYDDTGAQVLATAHIGDVLQCEAELMFGHVPAQPGVPDEMFDRCDFMSMLRCFRMYDVARDENGNPKSPPQHLLDAELERYGPCLA